MNFKALREFEPTDPYKFSAEDVLSIINYVGLPLPRGDGPAVKRGFLLPLCEEPVSSEFALGWLLNLTATRFHDFFRQNVNARRECVVSARAEVREYCARLIEALGYRAVDDRPSSPGLHTFLDLIDFESEEPVQRDGESMLVTTFDRSSALCKELMALSHAAREENRIAPAEPAPNGEWARDWVIDDLEKIYSLIWDRKPARSFNERTGGGGPFIRFLERTFCRITWASTGASALGDALRRKRSRNIPSPYFGILDGVALASPEEIARRKLDQTFQRHKNVAQKIRSKGADPAI